MPGWDKLNELIGYQQAGDKPAEPPAPAPEYNVPQPPATRQEAIQPMKNYDLLTRPERGLFERILPGVRGSWAGSAMNWVANNPIASKVLPWLDIFAEGVERTSGLMNQMEYYKGDTEGTKNLFQNLSETWKASSLNYNFADLPQLVLGDDIATEGIYKGSNVRGLRLPDDMPGVEGLNKAREMLIAGATMEEVEAEFEEEMGALWMRGQMYDMYGHILLDPLNYLMPHLAPIGKSALASRINKVTRISSLSDDVIASTTDLLRTAEKAGNTADVTKYSKILEGQGSLTTWEKIGDFLGGGRELLPDELVTPFERTMRKYSPTTLTPSSRGMELGTMVFDAIDTRVFREGGTPFEMLDEIEKIADGALSSKYGHYVLTPEGKFTQGVAMGIAEKARFRTKQYSTLLESGTLDVLDDMAKALDTTVDDVATALLHNKGVDEMAEALGRSTDELVALGEQITGKPYSEQLWRLAVKTDTIDTVEQASIAMYGIQQRGRIQAWAGVIKSAETLLWLKLNTSFPIKNYFTDELMMVAQGVTGKMNAAGIDEYWKLMGFEELPLRARQGIGMAGLEGGEAVADIGGTLSPIAKAMMGEPGAASKFSKWVNGINLGPLDMANYAQKIEAKHSAQAFTVWHQKGMNQWWKSGVGFDPIDDVVSLRTLELMEAAEPGLARKFNNWASSQPNKAGLDDFLDANYNVSMDEILQEARVNLGYDVDLKNTLPEEYLIKLKIGLPEAIKTGRERQFFGKFRRELQDHLDDMAPGLETRMTEQAIAQMKIEGPYAVPRLFSAAMDDFQGFHVSQAVEAAKIDDLLRGASKADAGRFWATHLPDVERTWTRAFDRTGAILKGIRKGTDGKLPKRVTELYGEWSGGWKKFYKVRNADYKTFFDARKAGKTPPVPWDTIKAKHSTMYLQSVDNETRLLDEMYKTVANQIVDPEEKRIFLAASDQANKLRLADKQTVIKLQDELIGATAQQKQRLWNEFWKERSERLTEIQQVERAGNAAMQGNEEAAAMFAPRVGEILEGEVGDIAKAVPGDAFDATSVRSTINRYGNFEEITQAESKALEKFINEFATPEEKRVLDAIQDNMDELTGREVFGDAARSAARKELDDWADELNKIADRAEQPAPLGKAAEAEPAVGVEISPTIPKGQKFLTGTEVETPKGIGIITTSEMRKKTSGGMAISEGPTRVYRVNIDGKGRWFVAKDLKSTTGEIPIYRTFDDLPEEVRSVWGTAARDKTKYGELDVSDVQYKDAGKMASGSGRKLSATLKEYGLTADDVRKLRGEFVEAAAPVGKQKAYLPDMNEIIPEQYSPALTQDQYWFTRGNFYIDAIEQATLAQTAKKPLKIADVLPQNSIDEVASWIEQTQAKYGDIQNAAVRMGEYGRDASLLNYNRRYNYNTWLGTVAPYEFWMTQSMMKVGLHSVDHPAMLSSYFRFQKMLETVGAPNQQIPSRLRDHFKVELPFLEDAGFMGNSIWVDPLRLLLPFKQYSYPFEEWNRRMRSKEGKAEYLINEWAENGNITQLEAEDAIDQQGGDLWNRAINEAEGEGSELRTGPFDFATVFASPHAPLMWAYHAANNETEKISPIMPLSRYSKAAQGLLGPGLAGDIAGAPYSVEAKIRTSLGLPAFDEWDDYRVERMMTNLAGEGKYPYEEVMRQWIAKEGPIWDEAKMLSDKEFGVSGMGSAIGLSLKAYPPGEKKQRLLQTELRNAFEQKEANPDAEVDPVWQFYEEHPEYSARQALWDEPEVRMRTFMFDLLYDKWNNMSTIHRKQVKEVIGDDIDSVLYPDDAEKGKVIKEEIPIGILQNWLMTMGGDVPGEKQDFAIPVEFIDPKIANRAQVYYDSISYLHPDFWDVSNEYHEVPENLRREWGKKNPEKYAVMKAGWDFKRDWLWRNPDVAPYITDNESWYRQFSTLQERDEALAQTPNFNPAELIAAMPQEAQRLVYDFVYTGDDLPEPVEGMLEDMAQGLGISLDELLDMLVDNK